MLLTDPTPIGSFMFLLLLQDLQNEQGGVALWLEICIWESLISNLIHILGYN